jgi:hypothetical protein
VVQKYGEIYGYQACKQIEEDERDEKRVVNMREQRLAKPWRTKYKKAIQELRTTNPGALLQFTGHGL